MEKVKEYIESQRTDEHKRKYVKPENTKRLANSQPVQFIS